MPYYDEGKKKWIGVVRVQGRPRQTQHFTTKGAAIKWEVEEKGKPLPVVEAEKADTGFGKYYEEYLDVAKLSYSKKTYAEKQLVGKRFLAFLVPPDDTQNDTPYFPIEDITPKHVSDFVLTRAQAKSANDANKHRKNLKAFWTWLDETYGIRECPVRAKKLPHTKKKAYIPTEQDVLKVLAAATGPERIFLLCYLRTGARKSEIFALQWADDINFELKRIRLGTKKTKDGSTKYVWLPMSQDLNDGLLWLYRNRPFPESPYVWTIPAGRYAGRPYTFRHKFLKGLCKRAKVKEIPFHSLRRFFASLLADKLKASLPTIQKFLRHENITTTALYIEQIHSDMVEVAEELSGENDTLNDTLGTP